MPIYEFKCLKCDEFFEMLLTRSEEEIEMACPKCKSAEFERVMSATSYVVGESGAGQSSGPKKEERQCSSGSCTTYEIPGAKK